MSAASAKPIAHACVTGLAALYLPEWGGQEPAEAANEAIKLAPDSPTEDSNAVAPALHLWRSLTLSHGTTRHHYREPDSLGRVNPLDSEAGSIPTPQVTLRYTAQGSSFGASPALTGLPHILALAKAVKASRVSVGTHF